MKTQEKQAGTELLLSYIGMDMGYNRGKLMFVAGEEDAAIGDVGTLESPALGATIASQEKDPVLFSYLYTASNQGSLQQLVAKLEAPAGNPARFSVLIPNVNGGWVTQTTDVTLVYPDGTSVINPHGLAQDGNTLYLMDYETTKIAIVDAVLLQTAATGTPIKVQSFDVSERWKPSNAGRGQAVIILEKFLYALFIDADAAATTFNPSMLFRLNLTSPLTYDIQTPVGINAQSIIPVNDGNGIQLLIPAIGGRQDYNGATNGTNSDICYVPALGASWTDPAPAKVTGDTTATPLLSYDIHAVAAAMRDEDSALFILTQIYTTTSGSTVSPDGALWRIYRTTVDDFLNIKDGTTLSAAASGTYPPLTVVDEGSVAAGILAGMLGYGISMWDMLYEQVPDNQDDEADRLWVAMGTPILITRAGDGLYGDPGYGSPTALFKNPYAEFGYIGGYNVNMGAFDLLVETLNQAKRGVSLKRTLRKTLVAPKPTEEVIAAAQAKAAEGKGGKTK